MFWADSIAEDIIQKNPDKKKFIIRDEKTLSGRVHVGSLRGVVIHGLVAQALQERGKEAEYYFEFNDFDPMDGLPVYLDEEKYKPYMGQPLYTVPSPDPAHKNYAEYFGAEFLEVINRLGFTPKIIRGSDLYLSGKYNKWIEKIIAHPAEIRKIYKEVSGSQKPDDWYPLQVICEKCGKVGTTKVTGVKGDKVTYKCEPDMVKWAQGCGHEGEVNPYDGRSKLPWKAEWAVKWCGLPVDIEGSGKDHNAAGGSHQIASRICKEILEMPVPYNIPYEFFLIEGAKMSSSKGRGSSSKEIADLLPPELTRFLMIKNQPKHPIDFNPEGSTIPVLFDQFDQAAEQFFADAPTNQDQVRLFHYSQVSDKAPKKHYMPRFTRVIFFLQMPHMDAEKEIAELKGDKLTTEDKEEIKTRVEYGKKWLDSYAPAAFVFEIQKELPKITLSPAQKEFLSGIAKIMKGDDLKGEALHAKIHELRKSSTIEAREAFQAIYLALLGKDSGPQAGWFLEALDKDFVVQRFEEAAKQ
ncbi:MAG: lysyl-tRNA synthetase, lysyl-tRNA synthetase, class I [Candidatus Peregrinibacteria bacterium GW2011_GWF2_43_17]|nr:MAG: lysyl-tRNA synthetase, lysyl-tRNA synthetase, class I [Candidatus Peregrinibacteria bacterium GW2011_GWF2_43_17]HAU39380.1 lysine--tRNA ligase [Candidatus Peregrinibacteria bacterium]